MEPTLDPRSSALSIASITIAVVVMMILIGTCLSNVSWQGSTLFIATFSRVYTVSYFLCATACLVGIALGIESYRRPTSPKVLSIIGILMNVTLLPIMAFGGWLYWRLQGPMY